jgi:hypothetical protein
MRQWLSVHGYKRTVVPVVKRCERERVSENAQVGWVPPLRQTKAACFDYASIKPLSRCFTHARTESCGGRG